MRSPHTASYATGPHYRTPHPRAPPRHLCCPLPRPRTNIAILRIVNKGKRTIYNLAIAMQQRSLAAASVAMAPDITLDQVPCWSDPDQRISLVSPTPAGSETPPSSFLSYDPLIGDERLWSRGPWHVVIPRRSQGTSGGESTHGTSRPTPSSTQPTRLDHLCLPNFLHESRKDGRWHCSV
jgi:hypothetical protein